ncbi:tetratricopeptide repeat protein [Pseudocolwellia sp. HL-MZ7]|uniref:tetratricopeptide repeat protein n=1 Tax=Pseudocolwellia sp. HL-MZ7 TaxID=3400627 RepID=UPI003CF819BF
MKTYKNKSPFKQSSGLFKCIIFNTLILNTVLLNGVSFSAIAKPVSTTYKTEPLQVSLALKKSEWTLAINNEILSPFEAEIASHEKGFARQIQPLLSNNQYQEIATLFNSRPLADDSTALQLLRAQILLVLKKLPDAEKAFNSALQKMPDLIKAHQGLSLLYMQQQEYNKAQPHLIRSIELGHADDQIYAQLAFIHVKNHQPWSAIAAYRQALMLAPEQSQYQQGLLYALIAAGDLSQANILLNELINQTPNDAQLWLQRGQIALQRSDNKQALASIEIALKLKPNDTNNQLLAAQLHIAQGSSERAVELIKQSLLHIQKNANEHTNQDEVANITLQTIAWLITKQQWNLVSELIDKTKPFLKKRFNDSNSNNAIFSKNQQAQFSVYTAQLLMNKGQTTQAIKSLKQALAVDPTLGDALISLANLYKEKQQLTQARLMYVRAQTLPEYQLPAWLGLAQIEIDAQNYKAALTLLKKAFSAEPSRQDLLTNINALEKLVLQQS